MALHSSKENQRVIFQSNNTRSYFCSYSGQPASVRSPVEAEVGVPLILLCFPIEPRHLAVVAVPIVVATPCSCVLVACTQ